MSIESELADIPGGDDVMAWFGRVPRFHDANLMELTLSCSQESRLRIHTWNMTNCVDEKGFFILEKHAVVTICAQQVISVNLDDFDNFAIIHDLIIRKQDDEFLITWDSSYGVSGSLKAKGVRIELRPGKPAGHV
jgi:hypothetical protein